MTPDDFSRFFGGDFDDQSQNAEESPLRAYFPVMVIERLRASPTAAPVLFFGYLKRLESESALQENFTTDLFGLLGDADGFDCPLDDLGCCLALAVFREHTKQCLDSQEPEPERLKGAEGRWFSDRDEGLPCAIPPTGY